MSAEPAPDPWRLLLDRQCGVVSRRQALEHGISVGRLRAQVDAERWRRLHPGVYLSHNAEPTYRQRVWAALLWAGPSAVACGATACWLDDPRLPPPRQVHVAIPEPLHLRAPEGVRLHRVPAPQARVHPVRQPPQVRIETAVLQVATASRRVEDAVAAVADAVQRRRTTPGRLRAELALRPRARWRRELERALADVAEGAQSPLELHHLRRVVRPHGLPAGRRQVRLGSWHCVDVLVHGVVVELDGRLGHAAARSRFRDMHRDNAAAELGLAHLRYGWSDVLGRPCAVAAQLATVLRSVGWTGTARPCRPGCPVT